MTLKRFPLFVFLYIVSAIAYAAIPSGYYTTATGSGATLKTQLYNIINGHTERSYAQLWTDFQTTDAKSNGKVWDMYSDIPNSTPPYEFTFISDQCGNYSGENSCYNREHSFPKSWFNDATPMYSDLFHLYPTDGYVNGQRGNLPFGEVSSPDWTSQNGSKKGTNTYPGFSGAVFEPIDDFKGDFARTYFYMATRYENVIAGWEKYDSNGDAVLNGTAFPAFETWFLNMLGEWHVADPVSAKETARNDAVYGIQGNRNPFIDHPEYVYSIWGVGQTTTGATAPAIANPTASNISNTAALLGANITSTGSAPVTESGIYYSTNNGFANGTGTKVTGSATTTGAFTVQVSGLNPATSYYYKAFATNSGGTAYTSQGSFTTTNVIVPQIEAGRIVNPNSALNFGKVSSTADKALRIKTSGATGNLTVTVTGNGFSASTTSITQANANNGYNLTIYFAPTTAGNYNGTLTISGGGLTPEYMVQLSGEK